MQERQGLFTKATPQEVITFLTEAITIQYKVNNVHIHT